MLDLLEESFSAVAEFLEMAMLYFSVAWLVAFCVARSRLFWWISSDSDDGHKTGEAVAFLLAVFCILGPIDSALAGPFILGQVSAL